MWKRDHPRVGGEKCYIGESKNNETGSPPRGRGKGIFSFGTVYVPGITPAWAGKRHSMHKRKTSTKDHPRVGGEKFFPARCCRTFRGSPPRGRGKDIQCTNGKQAQRITPAWAGKRLKRSHRSGIFISGPIPFHSVLHRPAGSGGSRAGRDGSLAGQPQNAGPA